MKLIDLNKRLLPGDAEMSLSREDFVLAIKEEASDSAVRTTLETLNRPPGRRPSASSVELAEWYRSLPARDKENIEKVIRQAAEDAVFGLLAIIDGVRVIEDEPDKGVLELYFRKAGDRVLLNDPKEELLHDTFNRLRLPA